MGDSLRIRVSQDEYEQGTFDCKYNLRGWITLNKGDTPLPTQALKLKLCTLWPNLQSWHLILLGKSFYEFSSSSLEDMRRIWGFGCDESQTRVLVFFSVGLKVTFRIIKFKLTNKYGFV